LKGGKDKMIVKIFGGINEIGGNKILVESQDNSRIFLDFGRRLSYASGFYQEFIQPRSKNILRDFLKLGVVPILPNIYRKDLIGLDLDALRGIKGFKNPPIEDAPDYWSYAELLDPSSEEKYVEAIFLTHAHYDHLQDISLLDPEIPIYCSEKTKVLIDAINELADSKVENQFCRYYDYKLSVKGLSYKTSFPFYIEIEKKGEDCCRNVECRDPELAIELLMENFSKERIFNTFNGKKVELGDFVVYPISVDHSVPGSLAYLVSENKSGKTLLYSGDFRFEGIDSPKFKEFIDNLKQNNKEIDVFICEGTRIDSEEIKTEAEIEKNLTEKMSKIKDLILIDFNWKDLSRFRTILNCCKKTGRTLVINPKLAYLLNKFYQKFPEEYINPMEEKNVAVYVKRKVDLIYSPNDYEKYELGYIYHWGRNRSQDDKNITRITHLIDYLESKSNEEKREYIKDLFEKHKKYKGKLLELIDEWLGEFEEKDLLKFVKNIWKYATYHLYEGIKAYEIRNSPDKYVVMFSFWDANELFDLSPKSGDMSSSFFIKASTEPFNDEMLIDEQKMMSWLDHFKIKYDSELIGADDEISSEKRIFSREHISGHAARPEIKELIKQIRPKKIIPIHTNHQEEFVKIGDDLGIEVIIPKYNESMKI
jgi:ribonuclease J